MSKLEARDMKWPNGDAAVELRVHNQTIGHATRVDGGWLVQGKRNPVATVEEAAKQCLDKAISQHSNEIQKLRSMLATVLRPNVRGNRPPERRSRVGNLQAQLAGGPC